MKKELVDYRRKQKKIVLNRDNYCCVLCYFKDGKTVKADDVHHVYGRDGVVGGVKESYKSQISVCRGHHNKIDYIDSENSKYKYVEEFLNRANEKPINMFF